MNKKLEILDMSVRLRRRHAQGDAGKFDQDFGEFWPGAVFESPV